MKNQNSIKGMKKLIIGIVSLTLILLISFNDTYAQNALNFDGTNDYVSVPGASAKIANSNQISLSVWAYPTNANSGWPNFDGICGFRNNSNADFYMLQMSSTNMEIRFRNSLGVDYNITYTGLTLNTWHHFVTTYDGSKLRFYDNGVIKDSLSATGNITNSLVDLHIGKLLFQSYNFCFTGKVDEVSLWDKTLSLTEINNIYTCAVNSADTNLQLYYKFDQGTAGSTNTGLTTLTANKGNINGTLYNFALSGTASNWVAGLTSVGAHLLSAGICTGDTFNFGTQLLTTAGTYTQTFPIPGSCDSTVILTLSLHPVNHYVHNEDICAGESFQWQDSTYSTAGQYFANYTSINGCDSVYELNLTVNQKPGAFVITGKDTVGGGNIELYTVPANPNLTYTWDVFKGQIQSQPSNDSTYIQWNVIGQGWVSASVVNQYGCEGDTVIYDVFIGNVGIEETSLTGLIDIFPNPFSASFKVKTNQPFILRMYDIEGKEVLVTSEKEVNTGNLQSGLYLIKIENMDGITISRSKLVKK